MEKRIESFSEDHSIKLPPAYILFESYRLDYANYYDDGKETALWIKKSLSSYISLQGKHILDWVVVQQGLSVICLHY